MNDLNTKLQGKNLFALEMYTNVKAFKSKLTLFLEQLLSNSFVHFPTLVTMKEASKHVNKTASYWIICINNFAVDSKIL